jgi:hypothetical protein
VPCGAAAAVEGPSRSDLELGNQTAPCHIETASGRGKFQLAEMADEFLCSDPVAA